MQENISDNPEVMIYPNPADREFGVSGSEFGERIEIYNAFGKKVFSQQMKNFKQQTFDVSNFSSGIYMVKIVSPNRISYAKLVKE
jgi:hypothetical protein